MVTEVPKKAVSQKETKERTFFSQQEEEAIDVINMQSDSLADYFKERAEIIISFILALLSNQHVCLIGSAGTAKSALIKAFISGLKDYKFFEWQLTKFSTPEELFGMYSIAGLKNDQYCRVIKNKLPECDIGYIDEIFNGNSSILNALNSCMNERVFESNPIPLKSVFGATNFTPEDSVLVAFYDRLMFRHIVERIGDTDNFKQMIKAGSFKHTARQLDKSEIVMLQNKLNQIKIPDLIIECIASLRDSLAKESIFPTDRRWKGCVSVLKAQALINKHEEVCQDDLYCLKNILWDDKKQIPIVEQVITKLIAPALAKIKEYLDQVNEILRNCKNADHKDPKGLPIIMEGLEKLKQLVTEIDSILKMPNVTKKVKEMGLATIKQIRESADLIRKEKLGFTN